MSDESNKTPGFDLGHSMAEAVKMATGRPAADARREAEAMSTDQTAAEQERWDEATKLLNSLWERDRPHSDCVLAILAYGELEARRAREEAIRAVCVYVGKCNSGRCPCRAIRALARDTKKEHVHDR